MTCLAFSDDKRETLETSFSMSILLSPNFFSSKCLESFLYFRKTFRYVKSVKFYPLDFLDVIQFVLLKRDME